MKTKYLQVQEWGRSDLEDMLNTLSLDQMGLLANCGDDKWGTA